MGQACHCNCEVFEDAKVTEVRSLQVDGEIEDIHGVHVKYNRDETVKWLRSRVRMDEDGTLSTYSRSPK